MFKKLLSPFITVVFLIQSAIPVYSGEKSSALQPRSSLQSEGFRSDFQRCLEDGIFPDKIHSFKSQPLTPEQKLQITQAVIEQVKAVLSAWNIDISVEENLSPEQTLRELASRAESNIDTFKEYIKELIKAWEEVAGGGNAAPMERTPKTASDWLKFLLEMPSETLYEEDDREEFVDEKERAEFEKVEADGYFILPKLGIRVEMERGQKWDIYNYKKLLDADSIIDQSGWMSMYPDYFECTKKIIVSNAAHGFFGKSLSNAIYISIKGADFMRVAGIIIHEGRHNYQQENIWQGSADLELLQEEMQFFDSTEEADPEYDLTRCIEVFNPLSEQNTYRSNVINEIDAYGVSTVFLLYEYIEAGILIRGNIELFEEIECDIIPKAKEAISLLKEQEEQWFEMVKRITGIEMHQWIKEQETKWKNIKKVVSRLNKIMKRVDGIFYDLDDDDQETKDNIWREKMIEIMSKEKAKLLSMLGIPRKSDQLLTPDFTPENARGRIAHDERNKRLETQIIKKYPVYEMRAGSFGDVETRCVVHDTLTDSKKEEVKGKREKSRNRIHEGYTAKFINARNMLDDMLLKALKDPKGNLYRTMQNLKMKQEDFEEELLLAAQRMGLLIAESRFTVHDKGPFAHARRGISGREPAVWVGEFILRDLTDKQLSLFLLDEALHVAFPYENHYDKSSGAGTLIHNQNLYNVFENILHAKRGITMTEGRRLTDMLTGIHSKAMGMKNICDKHITAATNSKIENFFKSLNILYWQIMGYSAKGAISLWNSAVFLEYIRKTKKYMYGVKLLISIISQKNLSEFDLENLKRLKESYDDLVRQLFLIQEIWIAWDTIIPNEFCEYDIEVGGDANIESSNNVPRENDIKIFENSGRFIKTAATLSSKEFSALTDHIVIRRIGNNGAIKFGTHSVGVFTDHKGGIAAVYVKDGKVIKVHLLAVAQTSDITDIRQIEKNTKNNGIREYSLIYDAEGVLEDTFYKKFKNRQLLDRKWHIIITRLNSKGSVLISPLKEVVFNNHPRGVAAIIVWDDKIFNTYPLAVSRIADITDVRKIEKSSVPGGSHEYSLVYDINSNLVDTFYRGFRYSQYKSMEEYIVITRLEKDGLFAIDPFPRLRFTDHGGGVVAVRIRKNKIIKVNLLSVNEISDVDIEKTDELEVLTKKGGARDFSFVIDKDRSLVDTYYWGLDSELFSKMDESVIITKLDKKGALSIAKRPAWAVFSKHSGGVVAVIVKKGIITEVLLLSAKRTIDVLNSDKLYEDFIIARKSFFLVWDKEDRIVDSFYSPYLIPARFNEHLGKIIGEFIVDKYNGFLHRGKCYYFGDDADYRGHPITEIIFGDQDNPGEITEFVIQGKNGRSIRIDARSVLQKYEPEDLVIETIFPDDKKPEAVIDGFRAKPQRMIGTRILTPEEQVIRAEEIKMVREILNEFTPRQQEFILDVAILYYDRRSSELPDGVHAFWLLKEFEYEWDIIDEIANDVGVNRSWIISTFQKIRDNIRSYRARMEAEVKWTQTTTVKGSGNVSCGTVCENGHEGSFNALDEQLKRQFVIFKEILRKSETLNPKPEAKDLTEDEADGALVEHAKRFRMEVSEEQLQDYRRQIRESDEALKSINIFFSIPETGTELFWVPPLTHAFPLGGEEEGEGKWTYAGGHFNQAGTRIHISLPLVMQRGINAGILVARHEMKHINCIRGGQSVMSAEEHADEGLLLVNEIAREEKTKLAVAQLMQTLMSPITDDGEEARSIKPSNVSHDINEGQIVEYYEFLKQCSDFSEADLGNVYPVSNEANGLQLAVGAFQNISEDRVIISTSVDQTFSYLAAVPNPSLGLVIDANPLVTTVVLPVIGELMRRCRTRMEFLSILLCNTEEYDREAETWSLSKIIQKLRAKKRFDQNSVIIGIINKIIPKEYKNTALGFWTGGAYSQLSWPEIELIFLQKDAEGNHLLWLKSEDSYKKVRSLWIDGKIRGVAGRMEGKAGRKIAEYLRENKMQVGVVYLSNIPGMLTPQKLLRLREWLVSLPKDPQCIVLQSNMNAHLHDVLPMKWDCDLIFLSPKIDSAEERDIYSGLNNTLFYFLLWVLSEEGILIRRSGAWMKPGTDKKKVYDYFQWLYINRTLVYPGMGVYQSKYCNRSLSVFRHCAIMFAQDPLYRKGIKKAINIMMQDESLEDVFPERYFEEILNSIDYPKNNELVLIDEDGELTVKDMTEKMDGENRDLEELIRKAGLYTGTEELVAEFENILQLLRSGNGDKIEVNEERLLMLISETKVFDLVPDIIGIVNSISGQESEKGKAGR
jgi:hypothetical protein